MPRPASLPPLLAGEGRGGVIQPRGKPAHPLPASPCEQEEEQQYRAPPCSFPCLQERSKAARDECGAAPTHRLRKPVPTR
jgi:hypothetical protein